MQNLKNLLDDIYRRISHLEIQVAQPQNLAELNSRIQALEQRIYTQKDKLTVPEACEYLGIAESTMYKMTCTRQIPHFKRGKFIYFERKELDNWLSANRIATVDETIKEYLQEHPEKLTNNTEKRP